MNAVEPMATRRQDLAGLLGDIERLDQVFEAWDDTERGAVLAYRRALEDLHAEALRRLVRALKSDAVALGAMRAAVADEVVYAVFRRHGLVKPSLNERVEAALEGIRPMLASHGAGCAARTFRLSDLRDLGAGALHGLLHAGVEGERRGRAAVAGADEADLDRRRRDAHQLDVAAPFALHASGDWLVAGTLADLPADGIRAASVGGEKVLLFRRGGVVTCFQDACAHLGFPIRDGEVEDGIITCPHHGFQYDLASGECLTAPEVQLQPHAVRVTGQRVEVRLSR